MTQVISKTPKASEGPDTDDLSGYALFHLAIDKIKKEFPGCTVSIDVSFKTTNESQD